MVEFAVGFYVGAFVMIFVLALLRASRPDFCDRCYREVEGG